MVQNSIIVVVTAPTPRTSTGSLSSHITSSWTRYVASISHPVIPTIFPITYPSLTPSLLPCVDTKEVPSPPPSISPPPDIIYAYNTRFSLMKPILFWCDLDFLREQVVAKGIENSLSTPPLSQSKGTTQQSFKLDIRHTIGD